jgi:ammonia channel protein AmtB
MNEYTNSPTTQRPAKRKRPHPARTARRAVGVAGIGSMLLMTGYMAVNSASATSATTTVTGTGTGTATAAKSTASAATPTTVAQSTSKSSG